MVLYAFSFFVVIPLGYRKSLSGQRQKIRELSSVYKFISSKSKYGHDAGVWGRLGDNPLDYWLLLLQ
jgi:hypothetical protein